MKQFKLQNYYKNPQNIEVSESLSSLSMLNNLLTNYPTKAINSLSQLRVSQLKISILDIGAAVSITPFVCLHESVFLLILFFMVVFSL